MRSKPEGSEDSRPPSRRAGERGFWNGVFQLGPATLDPRPDSETLIEAALQHAQDPQRILDLGTGTGCLLISLLMEWPQAQGVAVDRAFHALTVARANARRHHVNARAQFLCGDWAGALRGAFDVIVSNPPYIAAHVLPTLESAVRENDPMLALDGGSDGLQAYRIILPQVRARMHRRSILVLEIGFDQRDSVTGLIQQHGLALRAAHKDLGGHTRALVAQQPEEAEGTGEAEASPHLQRIT